MSQLNAFDILLIIMGSLAVVSLVFYALWAYLHRALPERLDPVLFREPFFNKQELVNYQYFPLSLVKSISYIYLVTYPSMAKRKRFKGLKSSIRIPGWLELMCKIQFNTGILGLFLTVIFFGYVGVASLVLG